MMAVLLRKHIHETTLTPDRWRCYATPARSTSLNLAVRYSDTVNSIVLQVSLTFIVTLPCRCLSHFHCHCLFYNRPLVALLVFLL